MHLGFILLLFGVSCFAEIQRQAKIESEIHYDPVKKLTNITLDETATKQLFEKWSHQAISGWMAAVATTKLRSASKSVAKSHEKCAKQADDIVKHAKCVVQLLEIPVTMPSDMNIDAKVLADKIKALKMEETIDVTSASPRRQRFKEAKTIKYREPSRPTTPATFGIERIDAFDLFDKLAQSLLNLVLQVRADGSLNSLFSENNQNVTIFDKIARNLLKNVVTVSGTETIRSLASEDDVDDEKPLSEVPESVLFDKIAHNLLRHVLTVRADGSGEVDDSDFNGPDGQESPKRTKRFTRKNSVGYSIPDPHHGTSLFGTIAKNLLKDVMYVKNKTTSVPWQAMIVEAQETAKLKKKLKQKIRQQSGDFPFEKLVNKGEDDLTMFEDIIDTMEDGTAEDRSKVLQKLKTIRKDPTGRMLDLLREGLKLGAAMSGRNASEFDEKQLNVMSPRFLSVSEKDTSDDDDINMLSPSIFSLHDTGKGLEKELSLPQLLKGFAGADQQAWLDLIFEASGVDETIKEAKKALTPQKFQVNQKKSYQETMIDENGEPLFFTKESTREKLGDETAQNYEVVEELIKTYSKRQQRDMNETGYTMMTDDQLQLIYGEDSPHNNSLMIELYSNRTKESLDEQLISEIRALAKLNGTERHKRDIVLSPVLFGAFINAPAAVSQPLILSPLLFTAIVGSPIMMGPAVLSPWVFIPLILSPRTLSPAILTPFIFTPVVLSPITLHPFVLCPGVFNPFILSPFVLAPLILSPQVFTPLILSPLVMAPFILNPGVGTPLVLSPFVLNPVILSPLTLFALVLSPNALSPVVMSKLYLSEIVLSPSWLS
uniref:Uncharacterized protein n=1 Tax=Panagrellus redivivus TaxID=6233 RepID=A0A7E4USQ1_PANRE